MKMLKCLKVLISKSGIKLVLYNCHVRLPRNLQCKMEKLPLWFAVSSKKNETVYT